MWLLRIARRSHWSSGSVADAARDLEPRREAEIVEDLSVFRVESEREAADVATVWVATQRRPSAVDYVLLPDDVVRALCEVAHRPQPALHPLLAERHYEILGLADAALLRSLAERLLDVGVTATRIKERDLRDAVLARLESDPDLLRLLKPGWR